MVGTYVGYNSHITCLESQPIFKDSTSCAFQNSKVNRGIFEYKFCAFGTGTISFHHHLMLNVNTIRGSKANLISGSFTNMSSKSAGGGFSVGSGNCNNGDSPIMATGKKHINN